MNPFTHTFSNGLRVIFLPSPTHVVYCGYSVCAGTRDEQPDQPGMAHFLEHMSFKGTEKRRAWHILNRMEAVGGDLNAFTTKEETVYYTACLDTDFERAVELLTDIVFHSTFPQNEIDKETEVIIDEIDSYLDTPSELIFDDFEGMLFRGDALAGNILGDRRHLKRYRTRHALAFRDKFYNPENAVFFIYGDLKWEKTLRILSKYLAHQTSHIPALTTNGNAPTPAGDALALNGNAPATVGSSLALNGNAPAKHKPLPGYQAQHVEMNKKTHQAHVMIGNRGAAGPSGDRLPLYLLNNILGGPGMNSRLNVSLREHSGLCYNVESNVTSYTDTGVFCIYFGCDQKDIDKGIGLCYKELDRFCQKPLSQTQLNAARKQLIGQLGVSSDSFENVALGMGKSWLHYGSYKSRQELCDSIMQITAQQLLDTAQKFFCPDALSTLIYR